MSKLKYDMFKKGLFIDLIEERKIISSAPYNGGLVKAKNIINYKVLSNHKGEKKKFDSIDNSFKKLKKEYNIEGKTVGFMTSAVLDSFVKVERIFDNKKIIIFLSAGFSNALTAGDSAKLSYSPGTINTICVLEHNFCEGAMIEAIMILTEAKTVALKKYGIASFVSGKIATGTGTDSIGIVNGIETKEKIDFCGKHTELGEILANLFLEAFDKSVGNSDSLKRAPKEKEVEV